MLAFLRVRDLAVLRDVEVSLGPGLNVLTGETGAGKSLLVDAVALLMGERVDAALVRQGESFATVEGQFSGLDADEAAALGDAGLRTAEEDGLLVRREIRTDGPHRLFLNGSLAPVAVLRGLMKRRLALHGQNRHLVLAAGEAQREALDAVALSGPERAALAAAWREVRARREAGRTLEARLAGGDRDRDLMARQLQAIDTIAPRPGEEEALRAEERRLAGTEERARGLQEILAVLTDDEDAIVPQLSRQAGALGKLARIDTRAEPLAERWREAGLALADLAADLRALAPDDQDDPERLAGVQSRLAALQSLRRQHGGTWEGVLTFADETRRRLAELEDADEARRRQAAAESRARAAFATLATAASERRRATAARLAGAVTAQLGELGLPGARFGIAVQAPAADPAAAEDLVPESGPHGWDRVAFGFAPHAGEEERPLARVASGGELSRLMLALHLAADGQGDAATLIFDEVDAGIGGATARCVGDRLRRAARSRQVICVTHLPEIAALADRHLAIRKAVHAGRARTHVDRVEGEARIDELARMIGSSVSPATARRHAEALLSGAPEQPRPTARRGRKEAGLGRAGGLPGIV